MRMSIQCIFRIVRSNVLGGSSNRRAASFREIGLRYFRYRPSCAFPEDYPCGRHQPEAAGAKRQKPGNCGQPSFLRLFIKTVGVHAIDKLFSFWKRRRGINDRPPLPKHLQGIQLKTLPSHSCSYFVQDPSKWNA